MTCLFFPYTASCHGFKIFALGLLLLAGPLLSSADAKRLHAVLIADTNSDLSVSVTRDINQLRECLEIGLPDDTIRFHIMTGDEVTSAKVLHKIRTLPVPKGDPVLVFFAGHGGYDRRGHFLWFDHLQERVYREDLVEAIAKPVSPAFWILLTDCCANSLPVENPALPSSMNEPNHTLMTQLFFGQKTGGTVNVNSCRPGQVASGDDLNGGLFTHALCSVFLEHAHQSMNWDQLFKKVRAETSGQSEAILMRSASPHYQGRFPQHAQVPYSFHTMYGKPVNNGRLGVFLDSNLTITSLIPDGAAQQAGIRPGSQITAVNGMSVNNKVDLNNALGCSKKETQISLRESNHLSTVDVILNY
ncbi:MAG: caspase family protein [Pirellulaceae bacterium]